MASLLFPDAGSRRAEDNAGRPAVAKTATVFANSAGTVLATIFADTNGAPGAPVTGSVLTTDAYGFLPLFWGPTDGTDRLWVSVNSGPIWPIDADNNARLDAVETSGGGGGDGPGLAAHVADTTDVHGIVNTAALETTTGAQAKVDTHAADSTNVHGIVDTALLETTTGAQAKVDAHTAATTAVHGITNTALLETQAAAQAKADAAQAAAIAASAQRGANLSDLASAAGARTNLGLGGAAVLNVGDTAGTVAAGNDGRFTDARTPTSHAASHAAAGSDPVTVGQSQVTGLAATLAAKADLVDGLVPSSQIPPLTVNGVYTVESEAEMLALPADGGDLAVRADLDPAEFYILTGADPTILGNWTQINLSGAVVTVNGQSGSVVLGAADVGAAPTSRTITAGGGLTGGGDLTTNRTLAVAFGTTAGTVAAGDDSRFTTAIQSTRQIATTAPLAGGGDLSANRTLTVANATTTTVGVVQLAGDLTGTGTTPTIATGAVTSAKIASGTIVDSNINAAANIAQTKIAGLSAALATLTSKVAKGDLVYNVRDYGATGDGTTDDTTAINNALAAAGAGSVVWFPRPAAYYRITAALTVPTGVSPMGPGTACEIRQMTNLKPVFDLFNASNCVVSGFTLTLGPGPSATMGGTFRGDTEYAYCAGVWSNGHRNLIENLRIKDFSMGVYLNGSNGTVNADGTQRVGNTIRNLEISGANHGILWLTQTGLKVHGIYYHDGVDSSAGVNPIHCIYGTGTTSLTSNDITVSDCVTVNCPTGNAYQVKYVNGLTATNLLADTCLGLFNGIDIFDAALSNMASRNDQTIGGAAYSFWIQTVANYNQRLTISNITIQMAGDGQPMFVAAHKTRLSNIQLVSNHTTGTTTWYDLKLLGTDITADGVTIHNVGTTYCRGVLAGAGSPYVTGNITITNLACQKVRHLVDVDANATGVNVVDYNPGLMRDILTSAGTNLVDQVNGTATFTLTRGDWTTTTAITGGATATPRPPLETVSRFVVGDSTAFAVAAPVCQPKAGMTHRIQIVNGTAGTLGTITWNAAYALRAPFQPPPAGETHDITFLHNGTTWREISRSAGAGISAPLVATTGLTGAVTPARFVGGTTAGAPTTGTFQANDYVTSTDGNVYICTVAGTPGTWVTVGTPATLTALAADSPTVGEFVPRRDRITSATVTMTSGTLVLTYWTADKTEAINTVTVATGNTAAGLTPTLCRMGIYSVAGNGDLTLLASTANDTALFGSTATAYPRALTSTFNKVVGSRYATAVLVVSAATMPAFLGWQMVGLAPVNTFVRVDPPIVGRLLSQTNLPASITAASLVGFQAQIAMQLT